MFKKLAQTVFVLLSLLIILSSAIQAEPDINKDLKFREEFGLNSERNHVLSLASKKLPVHEIYGVRLTSDEVKEMDKRITIQQEVVPEVIDKVKLFSNQFAGVYIDQKNGGAIHLTFKDLENTVISDIQAQLISEYSDYNIILEEVEYSKEELEDFVDVIMDSKDKIENVAGVKFLSASSDFINQTVLVGVLKSDSEIAEIIQLMFPAMPIKVRVVDPPEDHISPKGGEQINKCSVGYYAKRPGSSKEYLITTAHCSRDKVPPYEYNTGETYRYGDDNDAIGTASPIWVYQGTVDAMAIEINSNVDATRQININGGIRLLNSVQRIQDEVIGQIVCKTGYTSGAACGTLESNDVSYTIAGAEFRNLRGTTLSSAGGDSGGTVYSNLQLMGINKGSGGGYSQVYSHVDNINLSLGLTVIP